MVNNSLSLTVLVNEFLTSCNSGPISKVEKSMFIQFIHFDKSIVMDYITLLIFSKPGTTSIPRFSGFKMSIFKNKETYHI